MVTLSGVGVGRREGEVWLSGSVGGSCGGYMADADIEGPGCV